MRFAREGYPFVAIGVLLAGLAWIGVAASIGGPWLRGVAALLSVLSLFTLWFFRDPTPVLPEDAGAVMADGTSGESDLVVTIRVPRYRSKPTTGRPIATSLSTAPAIRCWL